MSLYYFAITLNIQVSQASEMFDDNLQTHIC